MGVIVVRVGFMWKKFCVSSFFECYVVGCEFSFCVCVV